MAEPLYRIKVKNSPGWDRFETGLVSISQGQECHEGAKLDALLEWALDSYERCVLNISDTLHRHNLVREGISEDHAAWKAIAMGDEWMKRNSPVLKKYMGRFHAIHRWDDWLSHPDFRVAHEHATTLFTNNSGFRAAALEDIASFMKRKTGLPDDSILFETSKNYLLEEIAAYVIISRTYAASRVYPAKPLSSFQYLRKHVAEIPEPLRGMEKGMCTRIAPERIRQGVAETGAQAVAA